MATYKERRVAEAQRAVCEAEAKLEAARADLERWNALADEPGLGTVLTFEIIPNANTGEATINCVAHCVRTSSTANPESIKWILTRSNGSSQSFMWEDLIAYLQKTRDEGRLYRYPQRMFATGNNIEGLVVGP